MKTHLLKTKDDLEFRCDQQTAEDWSQALDAGKSIYINGNRINPADHPKIRRILDAPASMLQLADETFSQKTPRHTFLQTWISDQARQFSLEGKLVYTSLLDHVGKQVDWDIDQAVQFLRSDWDTLQEYNNSKPIKRIDQSRTAPFTPENTSRKFCGNCLNGYLPGDYGLTRCGCTVQTA